MDSITRTLASSLSGLLRHNAENALEIDREGWTDLDKTVAALASRTNIVPLGVAVDRAVVLRIVEGDTRGRYEISGDGSRIRALSGHSFEVKIPRTPFTPTGPLWFGTIGARAAEIEMNGLIRSSKRFNRLSRTLAEAQAIAEFRIENTRHGDLGGAAVFEIDAEAMAKDGAEFFLNPAGDVETTAVPGDRITLYREHAPTPA